MSVIHLEICVYVLEIVEFFCSFSFISLSFQCTRHPNIIGLISFVCSFHSFAWLFLRVPFLCYCYLLHSIHYASLYREWIFIFIWASSKAIIQFNKNTFCYLFSEWITTFNTFNLLIRLARLGDWLMWPSPKYNKFSLSRNRLNIMLINH